MGTGCGFDLIAKQGLSVTAKKKLKKATSSVNLQAAGGSVNAKMIFPLHSTALNRDGEPLVLEQTPSVKSNGRRCMEEGFGFWWPPNKCPILYLPDGKQITLEVIDYIPYLRERESKRAVVAMPSPVALEADGERAPPPHPVRPRY